LVDVSTGFRYACRENAFSEAATIDSSRCKLNGSSSLSAIPSPQPFGFHLGSPCGAAGQSRSGDHSVGGDKRVPGGAKSSLARRDRKRRLPLVPPHRPEHRRRSRPSRRASSQGLLQLSPPRLHGDSQYQAHRAETQSSQCKVTPMMKFPWNYPCEEGRPSKEASNSCTPIPGSRLQVSMPNLAR
jgi:hypothetical protein